MAGNIGVFNQLGDSSSARNVFLWPRKWQICDAELSGLQWKQKKESKVRVKENKESKSCSLRRRGRSKRGFVTDGVLP